MDYTFLKILFISIFTFIVFGFIDSLFLGIYLNEGFANFFEKIGMNQNNSEIMVGALSASTAVIVSSYIEKINKKIFGDIIHNPILNIIGIIGGTYLYVVLIKRYDIMKNLITKYIHNDKQTIQSYKAFKSLHS